MLPLWARSFPRGRGEGTETRWRVNKWSSWAEWGSCEGVRDRDGQRRAVGELQTDTAKAMQTEGLHNVEWSVRGIDPGLPCWDLHLWRACSAFQLYSNAIEWADYRMRPKEQSCAHQHEEQQRAEPHCTTTAWSGFHLSAALRAEVCVRNTTLVCV